MPKLTPVAVRTVLANDLRLHRHGIALRILLLLAAVLEVGTVVGSIGYLRGREASALADGEVPRGVLTIALFAMVVVPIVTMVPVLAIDQLAKEKLNGTFSVLLATPLTPLDICLGKALALFTPGYLAGCAAPFVGTWLINEYGIEPQTGGTVISGALLVTTVLSVPLLLLALAVLTIQLALATEPELAMAPSFVVGLALLAGIPGAIVLGAVDATSWGFAAGAALAAAGLWAVVLGTAASMSKERIVRRA